MAAAVRSVFRAVVDAQGIVVKKVFEVLVVIEARVNWSVGGDLPHHVLDLPRD
jgi:hypothetical protein